MSKTALYSAYIIGAVGNLDTSMGCQGHDENGRGGGGGGEGGLAGPI